MVVAYRAIIGCLCAGLFATGLLRCSDYLFKVAGGVLAKRADIVIGELFADIFIAAYLTSPYRLTFGSFADLLRLRLDVFKIISICRRGNI